MEKVLADVRKAVSTLAQTKAANDAQTQLRRPWRASFNPNGCTTTHSETFPRALNGEQAWENFLAEELADRNNLPTPPEPTSPHTGSNSRRRVASARAHQAVVTQFS